MLLFDSVTRFARAQREIGLAIGEPPATRGYTPSVFDSMPSSSSARAPPIKVRITGVYTILVDGDDMDEPIADTVRGILDGHIVLSRGLAQRYQYPAVDVLKSVSRLVGSVTGPMTQKVMGYVRKVMAVYEENEDMITIGAYVKGSNPAVDEAIAKRDAVQEFLVQAVEEKAPIADTFRRLSAIAGIPYPSAGSGGLRGRSGGLGGGGRGRRRWRRLGAGEDFGEREGPAKREGPREALPVQPGEIPGAAELPRAQGRAGPRREGGNLRHTRRPASRSGAGEMADEP